MQLPQLIISMLLFLILFFGIGFILNMLLRSTWVMAVVYPIVVVAIVDDVRFFEYVTNAGMAFPALFERLTELALADILIFAGIAIRMLRVRGYQMF